MTMRGECGGRILAAISVLEEGTHVYSAILFCEISGRLL